MNSQSSLAAELRDKAYRDAFVASQLRIGLPMQCRALRESLELTQPRLAEMAGMSQPRISEIERPGERKLNLETLLRLASAFDVALQVRFVPFSELIDDDDRVDFDNFHIPAFEKDMAILENLEQAEMRTLQMSPIELDASKQRTTEFPVRAFDEMKTTATKSTEPERNFIPVAEREATGNGGQTHAA